MAALVGMPLAVTAVGYGTDAHAQSSPAVTSTAVVPTTTVPITRSVEPITYESLNQPYVPATRDAVSVDPSLAGVRERVHPEYTPLGARLGSFIFYPDLIARVAYDSNITAVGTNEKADTYFLIAPSFKLQSDWVRHALTVDGFLESASYVNYSNADYTNYGIGSSGRLDITPDSTLTGFARYLRGHQLPGEGPTEDEIESPLGFDRTTAGVRWDNQFNRIQTALSFDFLDNQYDSWLDGAPTDQGYRNGQTYTTTGRIAYEISPMTSVFTSAAYEWSDFENSLYDGDEITARVGLNFEPSRLLRGQVYVGYIDWTSDSGYLDDISHFNFGADLAWFATPLLTVTFSADQNVEASNQAGGSSILVNEAGVRFDYEFRRNVIFAGWFNYNHQDYEDYPRTDEKFIYGTSINYLINRYARAGVEYRYTDFTSNYNGIDGVEDYTRSVVLGTLRLAY
ncbi:MAG TPA: outer membrane beta-barrel protein [Xanthobacteraceae bacterium]|nr:outer membrane beta-barrel protein [Xanthobacteraceae bacterium]